MGVLRLVVFGFLALSVLYLAVAWYARSTHLEGLEDDWAEANPGDADSPARAAFLAEGMAAYNRGLKRKLVLLVYILPALAALGIGIAVNVY